MRVLKETQALTARCERYRAAGLSVGLVPTMGALHEGHVSLIRRAAAECDRVVVTIFVNPTQFAPGEDFAVYPQTPRQDLEACRQAGVDVVFFARTSDVYPRGFQTWVTVQELSQPLCGKSRPLHFRGVATVVAQLLHIVNPHRAYFGQKDYQQSRVILRLVEDLHFPAEVRVSPTVREGDGLALSSRNRRLSEAERAEARSLHGALEAARACIGAGERSVATIRALLRQHLEAPRGVSVDYAEVLRADTLEAFAQGVLNPGDRVLLAVAVRVGDTRLIDNDVVGVA